MLAALWALGVCGRPRSPFNRFYEPIWERADGATKRADIEEWVKFVDQTWLFTDLNPPWYDDAPGRQSLAMCLRVLREFGATWEPIANYADVRAGGAPAVKTYPQTPPISTRESVEAIKAANAAGAAAPPVERNAGQLERLADDVAALADQPPAARQ
jgi:hypothetical protein